MRRLILIVFLSGLAACTGIDLGDTDDLCRRSDDCAPRCGTVATGASPDCTNAENGGRTRG